MKPYTQEHKQFIKQNAYNMTDERLATEFYRRFGKKVKVDAITRFRQRLGIKKDNRGRIVGAPHTPNL